MDLLFSEFRLCGNSGGGSPLATGGGCRYGGGGGRAEESAGEEREVGLDMTSRAGDGGGGALFILCGGLGFSTP